MHSDQIDPEVWRRPAMLEALATRDVGGVYRQLQRIGVSQRRIAALTGQSQSEISEILAGRRVVSYDVLVRIADGLGIPRGHLGLAHDDLTVPFAGPLPPILDPASGQWIVRLPLRVESYGAAMSLLETMAAPLLSPSAAWPVSAPNESDRDWLEQVGAALVRLR